MDAELLDDLAVLTGARAVRAGHRAAELMVTFPERTAQACIAAAVREELFLYGDPDGRVPQGILHARSNSTC